LRRPDPALLGRRDLDDPGLPARPGRQLLRRWRSPPARRTSSPPPSGPSTSTQRPPTPRPARRP
jgi:hypothetical protein